MRSFKPALLAFLAPALLSVAGVEAAVPINEAAFKKPPLPRGYDCDTINTEVLLTRVSAEDGRLVLPDGMSYRLLVLPQADAMSAQVLGKLVALSEAGATIVGTRPTWTPGLKDYPGCDEALRERAAKLQLVSDRSLRSSFFSRG